MRTRNGFILVNLAATALLAGCAAGYAPPAERRAMDTCPYGQIWVCQDYYPTRLDTERDRELSCHCSSPSQIR